MHTDIYSYSYNYIYTNIYTDRDRDRDINMHTTTYTYRYTETRTLTHALVHIYRINDFVHPHFYTSTSTFERTEEQIDDPPMPQVAKEICEVVQDIPTERNTERIMAPRVDVPMQHVAGEILQAVKVIPQTSP